MKLTRLKKGELPALTGITTLCKMCLRLKDDALFKWQNGKRQGLVCRVCDLKKKRMQYATDDTVREACMNRARKQIRNPIVAKAWAANNQDRIKARRKTYHVENRDKILAKTKAWLDVNMERHRARGLKYYFENADKISARAAQYYLRNKDIADLRMRAWREKNKKKQTAYYRAYNLAKMTRVPTWSETKSIRKFYAECPDGFEVDHIIPLFGKLVSGLHVLRNLQYLTASENSKKSNKFNPEGFEP